MPTETLDVRPPTDVVPPAAYQSRNITTSSATPPAAAIHVARAQAAQLHAAPPRAAGGGLRRQQRVAQQHRDRHRADAAGDRRDQPGALARGLEVDVADSPASVRLIPTSITVGARLDPVAPDQARAPDGGDEHVGAAADLGEVARARVADGHGGVGGQQQRGDRAADQVRAADHDGLGALERDVVAAQQLHHARRRARPQAAAGPGRAGPADIGVRPSTSLPGGICAVSARAVDLRRRRELEQDPGHARVGVELAQERLDLLVGRRPGAAGGRSPRCRPRPTPSACCRRRCADAGSSPTSTVARPGGSWPSATQSATLALDLRAHVLRDRLAVDELRRHARRRLDGGPADPGPGARERLDHLARRLRGPATGRDRRHHAAARRVAQRQHDDVAVARGVLLGQRRDEAHREPGRDDAAGGERVVALERDPRLEAGVAAELADQAGRGRGRALDPRVVAAGRRGRRSPPPRAGGRAARPRTSTPRAACAPRRPRAPRRASRRNVTATSMSPLRSFASAFGGPHSLIVTSASGSRRRRSATASGTSRVSDDEWRGEPDAALLVLDQVGDLELGEREAVERGARVLDEQRAGRRSAPRRRASEGRAARRPRPRARPGAGRPPAA